MRGKEEMDIQYTKFTVSNPKLGVVTSDYTKQLAEREKKKNHTEPAFSTRMQPEPGLSDPLFFNFLYQVSMPLHR